MDKNAEKSAEMCKLVNILREHHEVTHNNQTYRIPHKYGYLDENKQLVVPFNVDWISPYSLAFEANPPNLNAKVMVMAQDWTNHENMPEKLVFKANPPNLNDRVMEKAQDWTNHENMREGTTLAEHHKARPDLWYTPNLPTNQRLKDLLSKCLGEDPSKVFFTNLFPFIKSGGISAGIPVHLIREMAEQYAKPQVEIIKPRIVICLGRATYNGLRHAYGKPELGSMTAAMEVGYFTDGETQIWCQAHTGAWGWNNRNKGSPSGPEDNQVYRDWKRMAEVSGVVPR